MDNAELVAQITRLVARNEIAEVLAKFCERVDEYDIDAVAELFTEQCVVDYGPGRGGRVVGRDAVGARIANGQSEFRRTHHQLGEQTMEFSSDTACQVSTYVTAWHETWDGDHPVVRLRYLDQLVRTDNGWQINERRAVAQGIEGFAGLEWVWVERQLPPGRGTD